MNPNNDSNNEEESGAANFLQRMRKGVENNFLSRPLPGIIKLTRSISENSVSSNDSSNKHNIINEKFSLNHILPSNESDASLPKKEVASISPYRLTQFKKILDKPNIDLNALRNISWNGIPNDLRPEIWKTLLGYLPANKERRQQVLVRKRKEYNDAIPLYFSISDADRSTQEGEILRQIQVDLPRTSPCTPFFQQKEVQKAMERILYIWSIRHPASGYVQGMNDLLTPILIVCIQPFVDDPLRCDTASLDSNILSNVEADAYWCLSRLLDNIQDHYTFSQPGLQRMILRLEDLIHRIDLELFDHFQKEDLHFMQFSFRWMNCALIRELPLKSIIRLWDTYFAEDKAGFENFHVYVCAVLLKTFRDQLLKLSFQDLIMFLQDPPTSDWGENEVEPILSQAYILSTLFDNSPSHLG